MAKNKEIGANSLIYVFFRKPDESRPFRVPMQGYYAGAIGEEAAQQWKELR